MPKVDPTMLAKNMRAAGYDVKWRPPRLKVCRGKIDEQQRKRICDKLRKLLVSYWIRQIDLIMDNKKYQTPTSLKGKKYLKSLRVRGHLRTKAEGLKPGFTKPHPCKHRRNVGGTSWSFSVRVSFQLLRSKLGHPIEKRFPTSTFNTSMVVPSTFAQAS